LGNEIPSVAETGCGDPTQAGRLEWAPREDEVVSIRAVGPDAAPEWLRRSWERAKALGVNQLSMDEIDAEIEAARRSRRSNVPAVAG